MKKFARNVVLAALAAISMSAAQVAKASMIVDLRFDGQSGTSAKVQTLIPNHDYTIDVWARITGGVNATNPSDEGFGTLYGSMQSAQFGGGAMAGGAGVGVTSQFVVSSSAFKDTSPDGALGVIQIPGGADNIQDIGTGTSVSTTTEIKVITNLGTPGSTPVLVSTPGVTAVQIDPNTVEFLLGSVTFHSGADSGAGGATAVNWVSFQSGTVTKSSIQWIDNAKISNLNASSLVAADAATPNNGVLFVVPEPASVGVLALGGLALLARRRRA